MKVYVFAPKKFMDEDLQPHLTPMLSQRGLRAQDLCKEVLKIFERLDDTRIVDHLLFVASLIQYKGQLNKIVVLDFTINFLYKFFVKKLIVLNILGIAKILLYKEIELPKFFWGIILK